MYDLSILLPCRMEEFAAETVKNILKQKRGKTEILVGLDGTWTDPAIPDHKDVRIIYSAEALGQRGMGNKLAKLSRAKYIAKTDGHCCFDESFDVKLMQAMEGHDDWTIAPAMKNLHAFNWVCEYCGMTYYQGEKPEWCRSETCHMEEQKFRKEVVFEPRNKLNSGRDGPTSVGYRFTPDKLQFKYFNALKGYFNGELTESMSLQGSFFMCTRKRYHELNYNDESWGGWGQQGSEVALKTWLSGGKVMIHRGTWYAHMFRTNGQLAFPWNKDLEESQGMQQHRARKACVDMFKNNAWEHQTRGLSWLIERFWEPLQQEGYQPEKDDRPWTQDDLDALKSTESRFVALDRSLVTSSAPSLLTVEGGRSEDMTPLTVSSLSRSLEPKSEITGQNILPLANKSEMLGIATDNILTEVVNDSTFHTGGDRTMLHDIQKPVSQVVDSVSGSKDSVASTLDTPSPFPASSFSIYLNPTEQLVEDIGREIGIYKKGRVHTNIVSQKGMLFFTDNQLPLRLAKNVQERLRRISLDKQIPLVSVSLKPMLNMGENIHLDGLERSYLTMFCEILTGLETLNTVLVFMCEHDCGYPPEHFDFTPPDKKFYYDQNWWKIHSDGLAVHWDADQVSGLVAYRDELIKYYKYRIETFDKEKFDRKFEPFSGEGSASWKAPVPYIDIRHDRNLTYNKRELKHFRNKATAINFTKTTIDQIPGWNNLGAMFK